MPILEEDTAGTVPRAPLKPVYLILYRFVSVYMFLFACLSFSIMLSILHLVLTHSFFFFDQVAFRALAPWVARHILRIHQPLTSSNAGDASFQWVEQFILLLTAILGAVVWSLVDHRRKDHDASCRNRRNIDRWLRPFVRLALACILFFYGFDKVFPLQFRSITRYDLIRQLGDLSHFDLMWNFMAASTGYTIFGGVLEVLAGILLMVPQLASLGALLAIGVLGNVVALNLAYNIPVKLLSTAFLLMAVYLAAPDLPRLFCLLVRNRPVEPPARVPLPRAAAIAQIVLGSLLFLVFAGFNGVRYSVTRREASAPVPLKGIWLVDEFTVTGGSASALFTPAQHVNLDLRPNEERWTKLVFERPSTLVIQTANGSLDLAAMKLNATTDEATLTDQDDPAWKAHLELQQPASDQLRIEGTVNSVNVKATLHRMDESRFKIRDQGLHLVQPGQ